MNKTLEDMFDDPDVIRRIRLMIAESEQRLDQSDINFRFMTQISGTAPGDLDREALIAFTAMTYYDFLKTWDGEDMWVPFMFATMTVRSLVK